MKNEILKPIYSTQLDKIQTAFIEYGNIHNSKIAGFNWRNVDFPYLHTHTHWEILIMLNGKAQHTINKLSRTITKGYACIIRPTDSHKYRFLNKGNTETLTFVFSNEIAEQILLSYSTIFDLDLSEKTLEFSLNDNTLDAIVSKTLTAQFQPKEIYEKYSVLIISRIINSFIEKKINTIEAYPEWLNNFLLFIKKPDVLRLSLPEIAAHSPYSYSRLSTLFKQYTGKTIINYLKELKLLRAKELLRNTNKSIADIAIDLNYESVSSLQHNFKKFTGLTPSEFRKSNSYF